MTGDMLVRIEYGDLAIVVNVENVENVAWSGEVMRDMLNRALDGLARGLEITSAYTVADDDDDAEPQAP